MKNAAFQYSQIPKGFLYGHECSDVKENHLKSMEALGALEATHKPSPTYSDGIHP